MTRLEAVDLLIDRYSTVAANAINKINELKAYRYNLTKPGFKASGWNRHTSVNSSRIEPYVIQAGDTNS